MFRWFERFNREATDPVSFSMQADMAITSSTTVYSPSSVYQAARSLEFVSGSTSPDGALEVAGGGEAAAYGTDTYAFVASDLTTRQFLNGGFAHGEIGAEAAATADDGDLAFAAAQTYASVTGADFVFLWSAERETTDPSGSASTASSSLRFIAFDHPRFDFGGSFVWSSQRSLQEYEATSTSLDGNVAGFDISAEAYGTNTYAGTEVYAFVVEDALSSASALSFAAVA